MSTPAAAAQTAPDVVPLRSPGFGLGNYLVCLKGILIREGLRFLNQRERFVSSLVRPLLWLFIFAAGFRQVLGVSIIPPYKTYVLYEVYITPGLCGMILLFSGMQSSLSMVYDREMGNMRTLLVSPFPRWFLLVSKLLAGVTVSIAQVYVSWPSPGSGASSRRRSAICWCCRRCSWPADAGRAGPVAVVDDQAARKFRRRHELRDLPDVFRLARALPAVAHPGIEPAALQDLPRQPLHLCRRTDPLRLLRPDRMDFACRRRWVHGAFPRRRHHRLRSFARADDQQTGHGRKRLMTDDAIFCAASCRHACWLLRQPALAAPNQDPDWPCIQRKVPELSLGQIWNGPELPASAKDWSKDKNISASVEEFAARRLPIADAQKEIRDFAAGLPTDQAKDRMAMLVQGLFDHMNAERSEVISGIAPLCPQAARARRAAAQGSLGGRCAAHQAGRRCQRDRSAHRPADLGNPDLRGTRAVADLCLRGADADRAEALRARQVDLRGKPHHVRTVVRRDHCGDGRRFWRSHSPRSLRKERSIELDVCRV